MNKAWFTAQLIWVLVKLIIVTLFVGTIAYLPFGAAIASLAVAGLAAKGYLSFKVAAVLMGVLFLIQGLWVLKWGEGLSIMAPYV